jgi:hypothetical protein
MSSLTKDKFLCMINGTTHCSIQQANRMADISHLMDSYNCTNSEAKCGTLNSLSNPIGKGHAIVQAVSHQPPTMAAQVRSQVRSCGIYGG